VILRNYLLFFFTAFVSLSCAFTRENVQDRSYAIPQIEVEWIRNGEPIEFEAEKWYPLDAVESLTDDEIYLAGEYRDIEFFTEKMDVRPFGRVYTKFSRNKFRVFEKDDKP